MEFYISLSIVSHMLTCNCFSCFTWDLIWFMVYDIWQNKNNIMYWPGVKWLYTLWWTLDLRFKKFRLKYIPLSVHHMKHCIEAVFPAYNVYSQTSLPQHLVMSIFLAGKATHPYTSRYFTLLSRHFYLDTPLFRL